MTRLSALSNVRLDNFVYTVDCFRAARERLTADGGLVLYFMAGTDYISRRLFDMLTAAFGAPPLVAAEHYHLFNRVYMAGPAFAARDSPERARWAWTPPDAGRVELASDDWPFLYLESRGISGFYAGLILVIGLLSAAAAAAASPELRRSFARGSGFDAEMFLFGLGFLLLETRSVTQMNLVWGATWLTSAVVFAAILVTILLATVAVQLRPISWRLGLAGLSAALVVEYFIPLYVLLQTGLAARLAASVLFVGLPIFFAAACFAALLVERADARAAFGWNLLGATAGGLLEFLSMLAGLRALLLVALAAYAAAALSRRRTGAGPRLRKP
jgi:hypothetical protein